MSNEALYNLFYTVVYKAVKNYGRKGCYAMCGGGNSHLLTIKETDHNFWQLCRMGVFLAGDGAVFWEKYIELPSGSKKIPSKFFPAVGWEKILGLWCYHCRCRCPYHCWYCKRWRSKLASKYPNISGSKQLDKGGRVLQRADGNYDPGNRHLTHGSWLQEPCCDHEKTVHQSVLNPFRFFLNKMSLPLGLY